MSGTDRRPADWRLPAGVTPGTWEYVNSEDVARRYAERLAGSSLFTADQLFVDRCFSTPGRVLDLGCGTGRSLVPLAQRGFSGVGVDLSHEMLRVCGENARNAGVRVDLVRANLVELDCLKSETFDCAICMFSTLGMIQGEQHRQRVLEHVHRVLTPGGHFVLHVHNRWFSFWNRTGRRWLLKDLFFSWLLRRQGGDQLMPYHQGVANLYLHVFTRRELIRVLRAAGFHIELVEPLSLRPDGKLRCPWWFGWLRAQGYLVLARKRD